VHAHALGDSYRRLPVRTGLTRPILAGDKLSKNPWADEISLPKILGASGYKTVLSGKVARR
jgi:arylsulfatase